MWPLQRDCDKFYGNPRGANGRANPAWEAENIVIVKAPYQLYYGTTPIRGIRVHRRVSDSLRRVFQRIWEAAGQDQSVVNSWGASAFSGAYVFRNKRGGATLSMHAYGCAIDLDAPRNGMGNTRPNFGRPGPNAVVHAFEAEGWTWGGRWSGRNCDGMHFQASRVNSVTTSQLRASGSRTIAAADTIKNSTGGIALAGGSAVGLLSQANDAGQQISGIATSVVDGRENISMLSQHWQIVAIVVLLGLVAFLIWRLWRANNAIVQARLNDAMTGVPGDQVLVDNPIEGSVLDGVEFDEPKTSDSEPRPPIYPGEWNDGVQ